MQTFVKIVISVPDRLKPDKTKFLVENGRIPTYSTENGIQAVLDPYINLGYTFILLNFYEKENIYLVFHATVPKTIEFNGMEYVTYDSIHEDDKSAISTIRHI